MCMAVAFMLATPVVQANLLEDGPLMMKNPSAMLTELEGMARSGETPAFELITTIKGLIVDDIIPGLQTTRAAAEVDTADALSAIKSCNTQAKAKEAGIAGSAQVAVESARTNHAGCREEQKVLYHHNLTNPGSYCVKLGKFLHDAAPKRIIEGSGRLSSVNYVKAASDTNICGVSTVTELDNGCTEKEQEYSSKKGDCLEKQGEFEEAFCTWKTELEANCRTLDTCHSNAETAYDDHVTKTKTLVDKWNVETQALQKILCFCNVWLSETDERDERSSHNATEFDVCKDETHTPIEVVYGTPAAKVACLLTSVDNHPGTTGFTTQEYNKFDDFYETVVPCVKATTVAPTAPVVAPVAPVVAPVAPVAPVVAPVAA